MRKIQTNGEILMIDNDYREVDTDEKNVSDVEETKEENKDRQLKNYN